MKTNHKTLRELAFWGAISISIAQMSAAFAQGTAFTYQGRLSNNGSPANGSYDLLFSLFSVSSNGVVFAGPVTNSATAVNNGIFIVALDFGPNVFTNTSYWLEIGVRTNGAADFSTLSPRQPLTPTPYAITAENLNGLLPASQLGGVVALSQLPAAVLTNNATGATLSGNFFGNFGGSFYGNGGGLNSLNAGQLTTGTVPLALLPAAVVTNNQPGVILGSLTASSLTASNLYLPATTMGIGTNIAGVIYWGGGPLLRCVPSVGNLGLGPGSLKCTNPGVKNTAIGDSALSADYSGGENTAIGSLALANNTYGSANTAIGADAMYFNSAGSENVANGYQALYNTSGSDNVAIGSYALFSSLSGSDNVANGADALYGNSSGSNNVANGYRALYLNTTGNQNTADGCSALCSNASGFNNTAVGCNTLFSNANGSGNIALGCNAGRNLTNGNNNIEIGNAGTASENNTIHIGDVQTNTFIAGVWNQTSSGGGPVYVNPSGQLGMLTSSRRFKQDIQPMGGDSEVLQELRPVRFCYKSEIDPHGIPQFGLVAEEVEKVAPELVLHDERGQPYSVRYEAVNAMLLNEFLKEHHKIAQLEARLEKVEQLLREKENEE